MFVPSLHGATKCVLRLSHNTVWINHTPSAQRPPVAKWPPAQQFPSRFCPEASEIPSLEAGDAGDLGCVLPQIVNVYAGHCECIHAHDRKMITPLCVPLSPLHRSWRCFIQHRKQTHSYFTAAECPVLWMSQITHLVLTSGHLGGSQYLVCT